MEDKIKRDTNYNELIKHRYVQRPIISHGCNSLFESIPIDPEGMCMLVVDWLVEKLSF